MFGIVKTTHAPTGIEHCCYCNILSPSYKNLVIAGSSQLHVYKLSATDLNVEASGAVQGKVTEKFSDVAPKKTKLECVLSLSLFGTVASMQCVRLSWQSRDTLLLAFKDAKMAVVEYDPASHDLRTLSLHYFEEEEFKGGLYCNIHDPVIRIDPDKRCAVMLIYGSHLVVFPFRRDAALDEASGGSRSPISSSYVIECCSVDPRLRNIIDIQFLHGYYEPTLFILHEPLRTWSGRIPVRSDTCSIAAISLNMQEKVHPIIWSSENLPYDALQAMPVPKPIGGVLVLAATSLLYLNQSVPPYAVSLSSVTDTMTSFPMKPQEGTKMALDGAHAAFLSTDQILISLRSGEIYVLTLLVDNMKMVRSFNFDKAASSVLSTCVCVCDEKYLFLGSRLGNSLLLKYTAKNAGSKSAGTPNADEGPLVKRKRVDINDWTVSAGFDDLDDMDELEVYGSDVQEGTQIPSYTFEVCDSIMNIGPCGRMNLGEPAFLAEEFAHSVDPDLELVITSGYGKNGALSVLQKSVRPQVVTTFQLPGCLDMWTVLGPPDVSEKEEQKETAVVNSDNHAFLILSREESTMILQTGDDIMELDHSGFSTQTSTVFAQNIGDNKYILQVTPKGIRLLQGVKQLQVIPIDLGSPIVYATAADPYVIIMSQEGTIMLLQLKQDRLTVLRPQVDSISGKIRCICLYKDVSGMFCLTAPDEVILDPSTSGAMPAERDTAVSGVQPATLAVDDEDELLYGDAYMQAGAPAAASPPKEKLKQTVTQDSAATRKAIKASYWAVLLRDDGVLQIYSIPEFKPCFSVKNFVYRNKVLCDLNEYGESDDSNKNLPVQEVKELLLVAFGEDGQRPYLLARIDEDLLVYEAFPFYNRNHSSYLQLRFKKVQHNLILREKRSRVRRKRDDAEEEDASKTLFSQTLLRPFQNISGYSGVFIGGHFPHWLIASNKGYLRLHPMSIDGAVTSFSPFHNVNCPRGFLYFNRQGDLRICLLPTHVSYDATLWPVRKVQLRCTPHYATYHPESKTYVVVTSQLDSCNKIPKIVNDEREFEPVDRGDRFVYPVSEKFALQLFSPVNWESIPGTRIEMEEYEHVTCCSTVALKSEGTVSGLQGYIAIGTNCCYSEDITSRGRMILFDIIEVVPEPGQPLTKNKIKILYNKEQKGPVTALNYVEGFLITAIGQKIYIWQLKDNDLVGVSFIDTEVYIHQLTTIKNIILAADIQKSIAVLRYQVEHRVISMVSREPRPLEVYGTAFIVDNTQLGFLVSDRERNLIIYTYNPEAHETHGGSQLLRKADFNLGSQVTTFCRVRCKLSDPSTEKKAAGILEKRHVTYFATLDGGLGYVLPLPERIYRRLSMLQQLLVTNLPHTAGLNPKVFRNVQSQHRMLVNSVHNMIDGDLVWKFLHMSVLEQMAVSKRIGTTIDQVVEDLLEIDRMAAHF